ncbi:MAG: alkaline phosphatase family protein [Armatimonadota bacterium]|nr:MAG: alkaline phosphatase family protein [Armatimonadota bacterium]
MNRLSARGGDSSGRTGSPPRVLVIGLDGATFDLLDVWTERGLMPNLRRLAEDGTRAVLRSVMPPVTVPAWTSCITGVNPGKHGLFDFRKRVPGKLEHQPVSSRDLRVPTLWEMLARAGAQVGLISVPGTYPLSSQTSFAISGMLTPGMEACFTNPPSLYDELRPLLGDYVLDAPSFRLRSRKALLPFLDALENCTRQRARYAEHLLANRPWDAAMVVFMGLDRLQHVLWDVLTGEFSVHPQTPEMLRVRDRAEKYISLLDRAVGQVLSACPQDTDVLIVSDHGFGPLRRRFRLNQWLMRRGLLAPSLRKGRAGRLLAAADVFRLRRHLGRLFRHMRPSTGPPFWRWIDWSRTRAYSPSWTEAGVYVNLKGREAEGIVAPGAEYEQVREEVLHQLRQVTDPDTGNPLVTSAGRREDFMDGPHVEGAPDVILILDNIACTVDVRLEGPLLEKASWDSGTGTHRFEGVLIGCGPRVKRGQRLDDVRIIDVTPTVLHLFGFAPPEHMDGRPLHEMLVPEAADITPTALPPSSAGEKPAAPPDRPYSEEEARRVAERLRDLGYL